MPLPENLEQRLGARVMQEREQQEQVRTPICPPVDPHLIGHLRVVFQKLGDVKPAHPQLSQLLLIQHGVDKVIDYLQKHYDNQSLAARKGSEI